MKIKFLKKGIKFDDIYYPVSYSQGNFSPESGIPEESITIYNNVYKPFPKTDDLCIINNTEIETDYFEQDKIIVQPSNKYYDEINKIVEKLRVDRINKSKLNNLIF